jgi:hypothetical protein
MEGCPSQIKCSTAQEQQMNKLLYEYTNRRGKTTAKFELIHAHTQMVKKKEDKRIHACWEMLTYSEGHTDIANKIKGKRTHHLFSLL